MKPFFYAAFYDMLCIIIVLIFDSMKAFTKALAILIALLACTTVVQAQRFYISPNGTKTLCEGDSIKIEAASGFARYSWSTGETGRVITATKTGRYICKAYDSSGKLYSDTLDLKTLTAVRPSFSKSPQNAQLCIGDSFMVEVTNKFTRYAWSTGATTNHVKIFPRTSGALWLITTDSNGCTYKSYIQYAVKNCNTSGCPDLVSGWPDEVLCSEHDSVIAEAKSGYKGYWWLDGATGRIRTIKKAGTYILKVQDTSGSYCYDTLVIQKSTTSLSISTKPSPAVICKGQSITLIASAGYKTYSWTGGGRYREYQVSPTASEGYVVTAVDSLGCERKEDIRVTVNNCDSCDNMIGATTKSLCKSGDSVIIEAKSGFHSYKWNTGETSRIISAKRAGWYVLTATTSGGKTCKDSVYVHQGGKTLRLASNPNPAVVCPGNKVVIEASNGFKSYWWNTGHRSDRVELYPQSTKTIVVEAVDSHGCEARAELKIIVKDTCRKTCPDIIGAWPKNTLCNNHDTVILEAQNGYKDYKWTTGDSGRILRVTKVGWYGISFKLSDGSTCHDSIYIGEGSKKKLEIFVYPSGPYCIGDSIAAIATFGFKSYWWSNGSTYPATALILTKKTKLVVEATDSNGCGARAEVTLEPDTCNSSLEQLKNTYVEIHPNPASQFVHIESSKPMQLLVIYGMDGKQILSTPVNALRTDLDVRDLKAGAYMVHIHTSSGLITRRILIE